MRWFVTYMPTYNVLPTPPYPTCHARSLSPPHIHPAPKKPVMITSRTRGLQDNRVAWDFWGTKVVGGWGRSRGLETPRRRRVLPTYPFIWSMLCSALLCPAPSPSSVYSLFLFPPWTHNRCSSDFLLSRHVITTLPTPDETVSTGGQEPWTKKQSIHPAKRHQQVRSANQ
jgi:hypothetical protein